MSVFLVIKVLGPSGMSMNRNWLKWEREYSKSLIRESLNDSITSLQLNKNWFSLESIVESSEIEETINISKIYYIYYIYIIK